MITKSMNKPHEIVTIGQESIVYTHNLLNLFHISNTMVTQLTSLVTQNLYEEGSNLPTPGI